MRFRLPGAEFPVLLMFVILLTTWLGVIGPIDMAVLKDWQPLMAALIALGAASMAYLAAMAKVKLDREMSERAVLRHKLALYLKIEFTLQVLGAEARRIEQKTKWTLLSTKTVSCADISIVEPPEIAEAWNYLDVFPMQTVQALRIVRSSLRKSRMLLEPHPPTASWKVDIDVTGQNPTGDISKLSGEIAKACETAVERLGNEIQPITRT